MPPGNRIHVIHTTVADFDGVFVKDFMVFVRGGEVLLNKCKESFTDVSLDGFAEGGVEPDYLSSSFFEQSRELGGESVVA